jgi:diguanylate cyclase (GGDEF)-like protein
VVGVSSPAPRPWSDDDQAFVEAVAAILGAAVRRHDLEAQLQHQALHDPLTRLPNRALVLDRIDNALGRATRRGTMLAVLLLDVDDFKSVNDALGHGTGDQLLAELARRLTAGVRDGDTVARLGGDEFVVVCEDVASEDDVAFVAESLLEACGNGIEIGGRRIGVSASIGVAVSFGGEATTSAMLGEADIAMYRAKRDRPGTYRIFDEAMRGDVLGRINVAGELRAAVRAERIDLAFQPIVELATGRVVALEALARWTNEAGQQIPPDLFIPVAEETGLIGDLGRLVLRDAARAATCWQDLGEIAVRVNASAHELRSHTYVDQLGAVLAETGLPARLLGLEITESVLVAEDKITQDNLTRLRDAGVTLLIDDFGTGYSSLSYLQRFPVVDVLKVDRSFLGAGTQGEAVVQAVVGLGAAFGLQVCAEGVETSEQHARVAELGCDFAQGYLLGRPVPADEVRELLAGWRPVVPGPGR